MNIRISKRYNLNCDVRPVPVAFAIVSSPVPFVPESCSNALALATPISAPAPEFLVEVCVSLKEIVLYGSTTLPEIKGDKSGEPYTLVTFTKLPSSLGVIAPLNSCVVLGFSISINVGETCSTSYPRTYALPGDTCSAIKDSEVVVPWSVVALVAYTPSFNPSSNDSRMSIP